jgi:hypothetical protein
VSGAIKRRDPSSSVSNSVTKKLLATGDMCSVTSGLPSVFSMVRR